jgi:hypothetical protein
MNLHIFGDDPTLFSGMLSASAILCATWGLEWRTRRNSPLAGL